MLTAPVLSGSAEAAGEADWREARRARGHPVRGGAEEQTQVSPLYTAPVNGHLIHRKCLLSLLQLSVLCQASFFLTHILNHPHPEVEVLIGVAGRDPHSR